MKYTQFNPTQQELVFLSPDPDSVRPASKQDQFQTGDRFAQTLNYKSHISQLLTKDSFLRSVWA